MSRLDKLKLWHQTKLGLLVFLATELAISYGFASLAIDQGNLWWYLLTIIFFIGSLNNLNRLIKSTVHGKSKSSKA